MLGERIEDHLRRYGAESTRVLEVFSAHNHMHPTDVQALTVIMNAERQGDPATPGTLRHALNLTSGAITGTVDRLVRAGHVRREPDPHDRRQTRLFFGESAQRIGAEFFGPLAARFDEVLSGYDTDQLSAIERFLEEITDVMAAHRRRLTSTPTE